MHPPRKRVARRPRRARYGGYVGSTERTLDRLVRLEPDGLHLVTDDHPSYRRAVCGQCNLGNLVLQPEHGLLKVLLSGSDPATLERFACDLLHGLARHSMAAHRRETIAFGRRLNALMLRVYGFVVWRNFVKRRSERRSEDTTPAMVVGLTDRRWTWGQVFARRRFPGRDGLDATERVLYEQRWRTPVLRSNARHALRFAY